MTGVQTCALPISTRPTSINESDPAATASIPLDIDYLPSPALPCADLSDAAGNDPVAGE